MLEIIEQSVNELFNYSDGDFFAKNRKQPLVKHRQIFFHICNKYTPFSTTHIGRYCGKHGIEEYDHATILHATKTIENQIGIYEDARTTVQEVINEILTNPGIKWNEDETKFINLNFSDIHNLNQQDLEKMILNKHDEMKSLLNVYTMKFGLQFIPKEKFDYIQSVC